MYATPKAFIPAGFAVDFGTFTASGSNALINDVAATLPKFKRSVYIVNARLRCTTAVQTGATAVTAVLLNGTKTAATFDLTGATADTFDDGTMVTTSGANRFAAGVQPTIKIVDGTSTASGGSLGDFDIWFEVQ
jgi:hypothetical protein